MNLKHIVHNELLPRVEKPSRYLGNELNTVHKNPADVDLRVCFFFPDLYELGLGNLGLHILYAILNERDWVWAERGYTPAPDMEAALRERDLPLFMHESKDPLNVCDLVGFTLQSELTYTNILNALDMANIPLRSKDRSDSDPLIFAGGPAVFNPEPIAPFLDFFLIGEGEDAVVEIAEALRALKDAPRIERLRAMEKIEGVYVPELYPFEEMPDGQILPKEDAPKIRKRLVESLDGATFPSNYIVPYTQLVHDGIGIEVLRGCTQGCRFCQAGMVTRPVRERSLENVDQLMERTLDSTGMDAVSLVSLSTCDFSRPRTLVKQTAERAQREQVSVSLPSLRLDSFAVEMADMVTGVRRSGLTFAPEAATPRLRAVINKFIPDEGLLTMAAEAYRRDWDHVKTYFMIGLPTERDEDVIAIADLCIRTLKMGREINHRAGVRTGVSTFIPKPFTPFQWAEQISLEETYRRQGLLNDKFRKYSNIKFGHHDARASWLEGLLARADRRGADLIEAAWRRGARLEAWDEHLNIPAWEQAVEDVDYPVAQMFRQRDINERLPWDHIDILIDKEWLQKDWLNAMELKYAQDCRAGKCHLCGVIYRERELCKHMIKNQKAGHKLEEETWEGVPEKSHEQPDPVQRLRVRIGRTGELRFLSHLEHKEAWIRALRRAHAPLAYTKGFHAQPRLQFAAALPVGEETICDFMDIMLREHVDPEEFRARLSATVPNGLRVFEVDEVPLRGDSLMAAITGMAYQLHAETDHPALPARIRQLVESDEVIVTRKLKAKKRKRGRRRGGFSPETQEVNIRPMLDELRLAHQEGRQVTIAFTTMAVDGRMAKPKELVALLELDPDTTRVVKTATYLAHESAMAAAG
jgi:radical SAM family uncharacterized protein/radical SAM-linked protein